MSAPKTTTTSESKPPAWATPLFQQSASEAQKLYNNGSGGGVYQGQTVANQGANTLAGIQGVANTANAYGTTPNALTGQTSAASNLGALASGQTGTSNAQNYLTDYANGSYLKAGNPYFNDALQGQLDSTASQVQSQFSGAGRYGSGANTNALASQLGNIRSSALASQFNQDTQNQFNAVSQLDQQRQVAAQNQLAASGQIDSSNLNSANALNNWNQNALGANQALIQAGQSQDANQQDQLTAALNKFQATDMQDWTRLGLLQSAASGAAGNYGTNIQQSRTSTNPLSAIGSIGSLATKSDIRLKENIVPVGEDKGYPIYEWNYIGAPDRFRGVMAQDVLEITPEAVVMEDDGFYAVYYDRIGLTMEAL